MVESEDNRELGLLKDLRRTNPEKFKRLEERFFTPATSGGPCPAPSFPGCQEFFKDFIVAAESYAFNQHLMNCLAIKISELNGLQLYKAEQDASETNVLDDEQREHFIACFLALRVLAKFLGFLTFLPYIGSGHLPDDMKQEVLVLRNKAPPLVDLLLCLQDAIIKQRLILVVPWVVEFLSMMDSCAVQLQLYTTILKQLVSVYRLVASFGSNEWPSFNRFLLLLILGWLFEIPSLGGNIFFAYSQEEQECPLQPGEDYSDLAVDYLPLIDQQTVYTCCPYLGDIRVLLAEASLGIQSKTTPMKKITPVAADTPLNKSNITDKSTTSSHIQVELERNFFHTNSPSLKKTVEFIAHRVSSNCIKHIDASLLVASRKDVNSKIAEMFARQTLDQYKGSKLQKKLNEVKQLARKTGDEICQKVMGEATSIAKQFVETRCKTAMCNLLADETSSEVVEVASAIATRNALERVEKWVQKQISGALQQEVQTALMRFGKETKKRSTGAGHDLSPSQHDGTALAPSALIQLLKDISQKLLLSSESSDEMHKRLREALQKTECVLKGRQDMTPVALATIQNLIRDLLTLVIVKLPNSLNTGMPCSCVVCKDASESKEQCNRVSCQTMNESGDKSSAQNLDADVPSQTRIEKQQSSEQRGSHFLENNHLNDNNVAGYNTQERTQRVALDLSNKENGSKSRNESSKVHRNVGNLITSPHHLNFERHDEITEISSKENALKSETSCEHKSLLDLFVDLCKDWLKCQVQMENLLSARTVFLMSAVQDPHVSWERLVEVLETLISANMIQLDRVEDCLDKLQLYYVPGDVRDKLMKLSNIR